MAFGFGGEVEKGSNNLLISNVVCVLASLIITVMFKTNMVIKA